MVRGSHYIMGGSIKNLDELAIKEKTLALQLLLRPWPFIISNESNFSTYAQYAALQVSGIYQVNDIYRSINHKRIKNRQRNRNKLEFLLLLEYRSCQSVATKCSHFNFGTVERRFSSTKIRTYFRNR